MEKHLFITLKSNDDFISDLNLINSYNIKNPYAQISILTFKDNSKITEIYPASFNFEYIDKSKIKTIIASRLFCDAFAINTFMANLGTAINTNWDISHDLTGTDLSGYIHAAIKSENKNGVLLNKNKMASYPSDWIAITNDLLNPTDDHFFNPTMINQSLLNIENISEVDFKVAPSLSHMANTNFSRIRNKIGNNINIIGLDLAENQTVPFESYCEIINKFYNSFDYFPVIIYKNEKESVAIINKINAVFDNTLICIKYEYSALPAILKNLDYVVTQNSTVKHFSDATDTPNILITKRFEKSNFSLTDGCSVVGVNVLEKLPEDVFNLTNSVLNPLAQRQECTNETISATLINGAISIDMQLRPTNTNITNLLNSKYILDYYRPSCLGAITHNISLKDMSNQIKHEKEQITEAIKILLSTIRILKSGLKKSNELNKFIGFLDQLFTFSEVRGLASTPLKVFKSKVERIQEQDPDLSLKLIEGYLFELKNDFKFVTKTLSNVIHISTPARGLEL
jgi:ADP-heptose:LPS heptosyltransferase